MKFSHLLLALHLVSGIVNAQAPNPLTITPTTPGNFDLSWFAENLRPYVMETSPDLLTWADIPELVVGTGSTQTMLVFATVPKNFYRLREGAVRPGFDGKAMARGDDQSYPGAVDLGFNKAVKFYGRFYSECYINSNGNITFGAPFPTYTPKPLGHTLTRIIAPFWADVDTSNAKSEVIRFSDHVEYVDEFRAFGVTYKNVGYFDSKADKLNWFQVVLIERNDVADGDFDIEFNYNHTLWETGDVSGGSQGYGGMSARVGVGNDNGLYFEYKGSGQTLALLDNDPETKVPNFESGLIYQSLNSSTPGRIVLPVRNGEVQGSLSVSAGADRILALDSGAVFTLEGSCDSADTTGIVYTWSLVGGSGQATFSDASSLTTQVTISEPGSYEFKLEAVRAGDFEARISDKVIISHPATYEVNSGYYELSPNDPLSVTLEQAIAMYSGGGPLSIEWTQLAGEPAIITNPTSIHPVVTIPGPGEFAFRMTVSTNHANPFVFTSDATVCQSE